MIPHVISILGVSGSLRAQSSNLRLLQVVAELAPPDVRFAFFEGIGDLPHFNPDIDREEDVPPAPVLAWREAIRAADGVVISCPEYAHGLPGSFKNALDWLVSSADLMGKPILLLNASPVGGEFAQPQLAETLTMLGGAVLPESLLQPFLKPAVWSEGLDSESGAALRSAVEALLTGNSPPAVIGSSRPSL